MHLHGPICYSFHSLSYCISYLVISLNQRSTSKVHFTSVFFQFTSLSIWRDKNDIVLGLPGMESTFFPAGCIVLGFAFVATAVLVPDQCLGYCWTVFTYHQGRPSSSAPPRASRLGVHLHWPRLSVLWWCYFDFGVGKFCCWCKRSLWKVCSGFTF